MISAYCPGHLTCFFRPVGSEDILHKGSSGAGIRLEAGTTASVREISGRTEIIINGAVAEAEVTRKVLGIMAPGRSFEVTVRTELPIGQGFGMSASGAIAVALCVAQITGAGREDAFRAAHEADIAGMGGLGDVSGLVCNCHHPVRVEAGLPPAGRILCTGSVFREMTLAAVGKEFYTPGVLSDPEMCERIAEAGDLALTDYMSKPSKELLFSVSNRFSSSAGVESGEVRKAIMLLRDNGIRSAMCMLGKSIFTDAPKDDIRRVLGDDVTIISTASTDSPAAVIRKG